EPPSRLRFPLRIPVREALRALRYVRQDSRLPRSSDQNDTSDGGRAGSDVLWAAGVHSAPPALFVIRLTFGSALELLMTQVRQLMRHLNRGGRRVPVKLQAGCRPEGPGDQLAPLGCCPLEAHESVLGSLEV